MISAVVGIDYYNSIRRSFAYICAKEVVKNVHVKKGYYECVFSVS